MASGPSMASTVIKQEQQEGEHDWYYQYRQWQDGEASDETTGSLTNGDINNMLSRSQPIYSNSNKTTVDADVDVERIKEAKKELLVMMQSLGPVASIGWCLPPL